ncbi:16S rRNA (cytidine(1402)-2'-O)-methyltransferase [Hyphobacterium sp. CCMP332]|nr:16S rRNA (cytidine(1402)-2'-O)-methyltransferase [Hyphobacterium sp. CCMP332]
MEKHSLYFIGTPIGNLADMSERAKEVLSSVDIVLAEDTRNSGLLLKHFSISAKMESFHAHNEHKVLEGIIERIQKGETFALISDAGMPAISDPGYLLLRAAVSKAIDFTIIPGPAAFLAALLLSGFPTDKFIYEGFIPHKKGRQTFIEAWKDEKRTVVFYESPHRIVKCLEQMKEFLGPDREVAVVREITKKFEETIRGSLEELCEIFKTKTIKGEFVVVLKGEE